MAGMDGLTPAKRVFGRRLRYWRRRAGLTQLQLATKLQFGHTYVSRLESGQRQVQIQFALLADDLLAAGGELAELASSALAECDGRSLEAAAVRVEVPLPGLPERAVTRPVLLDWQGSRLPDLAIVCPLHPREDCSSEIPTELAATEDGGQDHGEAAVHLFVGLLAAHTLAGMESTVAAGATEVEHAAHDVVHRAESAQPNQRTAWLHLAAGFAAQAADQRAVAGQFGQAVTWLHRSVEWGAAGNNISIVCQALANLSVVARMEGDAVTAMSYAEAAGAQDRARPWMSAHSLLHQARACALRADQYGFEQRVAAARRLADTFREDDRFQARWLHGAPGEAFVQSYLAGGLRDLSIHRADRALARHAVRCAQDSLAAIPAHLRTSRLLLGIRMADCLARAGERDDATAVVAPLWEEASTSGVTLIRHELRYLRSSLRVAPLPGNPWRTGTSNQSKS